MARSASTTVSLTPFLDPSEIATLGLAGPNVLAWADLTDDDTPSSGEIIRPDDVTGAFTFPTTNFDGTHGTTVNPTGSCTVDPTKWCTWDGRPGQRATSWNTNLKPSVVNMFWLANVFHQHLAGTPIGFTGFTGNADRIYANGLDGALTGPNINHLDNANMTTLPEGEGALMQMYLATTINSYKQRDVDYDYDPLTIWHEYAHGLSNRLITDTDGYGALDAQQSGAMGEGWSDWYALDAAVSPPAGYPTSAIGARSSTTTPARPARSTSVPTPSRKSA